LGLSIIKRLAELHSPQLHEAGHAVVGVNSQEGKGSTFWALLQVTVDNEKQLITSPHSFRSGIKMTSPRILQRQKSRVQMDHYDASTSHNKSIPCTPIKNIKFCLDSPEPKMVKEANTPRTVSTSSSTKGVHDMKVTSESPLVEHVLVVDDEPITRRIMALVLKQHVVSVTTAVNGQDAVDLCKQRLAQNLPEFDCIFMDHVMPIMNGVEATQTLRNLGVSSPIIACTANCLESDIQRFTKAGCDMYLTKPCTKATLLETLNNFVVPKLLKRQQ
jgi:CheY-like chemotaxis protein